MTKLVSLASLLVFAAASPALADAPIKFERDGVTYVGTVREQSGVRYISGHELGRHRAFELRVANGWVTGNYGGDEVSYPEPVRLVAAH